MNLILDFGLAWISVLLVLVLALKYVTRKLSTKSHIAQRINKVLKETHIPIGILLVLTGLIHGLYSSQKILSLNLGTLCWVISILLGLNYALRKKLKNIIPWIVLHRILTVLMVVVLVWHVIDVGGIQVLRVLLPKDKIEYQVTDEPTTIPTTVPTQQQATQETTTPTNTVLNTPLPTTLSTPPNSNNSNPSSNNTSNPQTSNPQTNNPQTNIPPTNTQTQTPSTPTNTPITLAQYNNSFGKDVFLKDGAFEGIANGYGPNLTVSVVIKSNRIKSITVISHNERNSQFYQKPIDTIPGRIISGQTFDVDTITGATMTSVGIINATNNALSKALTSGTLPTLKQMPQRR